MQTKTSLDLFLIASVLAAGVYDLALRKIPNRLVLCGVLCAALLHLVSGAPAALVSTGLAGLATGLLVFLPLYCVGGMAAGDVKLMGMVGAFTGPALAFDICLASFCIGGVMGLVIAIARGRLSDTLANVRALLRPLLMRVLGVPLVPEPLVGTSVGSMPYGVAIALGTFAMLWFRHR
jgi:prepilin peptidase CpaA